MPIKKGLLDLNSIIVHTPTCDETLHLVLNNMSAGISPDYERYARDDIGFSNLFADIHRDDARFVVERNRWYCYDGTRWVPDDGTIMEHCKAFARVVSDFSMQNLTLLDKDEAKEVTRLTTRRARETIIKDAATVYPIKFSEFDNNPMLLNCQNGTIDLDTGTLRPHSPDDLITKIANVDYVPGVVCDRWTQHIDEVMEGNIPKAEFLQKAIGSCLTGSNPYERFYILYGATTRNGKSCTMETIASILGDYSRSAKPETVAQKQNPNSSGPSEDIARLAGARFVNIPEPDKKLVLSSALVKSLTGNDTITARFLHENSIEFHAGFKIFINTNHLPRVIDRTLFNSGRVNVIEFGRHFEEHEQDKTLKSTFLQPQNRSGILNWCLAGLKLIETQGFEPPLCVRQSTAQYEYDSDKIAQFMQTCLVHVPGINTRTEEVYAAYQSWCNANGLRSESLPQFRQLLAAHVRIDKSRYVGDSPRLDNPVSCVFDYLLQAPPTDVPVKPLTDDEINLACTRCNMTFSSNPNVDNRVDISWYHPK